MSGSILKLIACLAMLIDHMAAFLPGDFMDMKETLFTIGDKAITLRLIMHYIGRMAFPLFAFLITEGFTHTHDRKKYGINLFIFALISEIPWNLAHTGELFYGRQNVFFTLLLGYIGLCALDHYKNDYKKMTIALASLLGVSLHTSSPAQRQTHDGNNRLLHAPEQMDRRSGIHPYPDVQRRTRLCKSKVDKICILHILSTSSSDPVSGQDLYSVVIPLKRDSNYSFASSAAFSRAGTI